MTNEDMQRKIWYADQRVKFEIVKALQHHELQIIREGLSIRWLNVGHVKIYDSVMMHLNVVKTPGNLYRGLDQYSSIPLMSFNLGKRQKQYDEWAEKRLAYWQGMDFGVDIDCKAGTWKDAIPDNEILRKLFDSFGVRYANWCSGSHGFHFVMPFEDMPSDVKGLKYSELINFYRTFAIELAKKARNIDLSIYMPTRVLKAPYTITKNGLVVLPLGPQDWEQLKTGELNLEPLYVLKNVPIYKRGIYLQGREDGIKNMIKNWEGWS